MHFHYMTYMVTHQRKNPCPGGHEIYNLGRPFLGHHYYKLILSETCPRVQKKIFLRNTSILHILPQNYLHFGWGSCNLQFLVSLPYRCYIPNLVKIGSVDLAKKMLTDDDACQPIAIGHLSDSDKKISTSYIQQFMRTLMDKKIE